MNKYSLSALAAAGLLMGGLSVSTANAADLGGDCCADLEERVAELEATTARKGNRKVSLTISGMVAQQILAWDDGQESNVYVTDTGSVSIGSHFALAGEAKIAPGYSAGFAIKLETMSNDSLGVSQNTDDGGNVFADAVQNGGAVALESAYWYLKSEQLGRVSVGQQGSAADNQAIIVDGSGSLIQANYVLYDVRSFVTRNAGGYTGFTWGALADCKTVGGGTVAADCDGYPNNNVRYDTPTFGGFSASASWGEDDIWAVSGRYAGEFSGFKFAAAVAYVHSTDETSVIPATNGVAAGNGGKDAGHVQTGAYLEHTPSGLFVYGAYGYEDPEVTGAVRGAGRTNPDGENYYVKAGIKGKWLPYGGTTFYGEYGRNDDKFTDGMFDAGVNASELEQYGIGVVQNIDAAAMSLWLSWRHYEGDVDCAGAGCAGIGLNAGSNSLEEFDIIKAGALITF
ncbi:MAG: porin [Hyphomicrobiaceae bacterium]|nr:porin [Hyphomicrobiaceae bacterium]